MGETITLDGNGVTITPAHGNDWFAEVNDAYYGFYLFGNFQHRIVITNGNNPLNVIRCLRGAVASGNLSIIPNPLPGELFGPGSGGPHPHKTVH